MNWNEYSYGSYSIQVLIGLLWSSNLLYFLLTQTYEEYLQRHGQGHLRDCNGYPQVRLSGSPFEAC
jgi:hypothetical protein